MIAPAKTARKTVGMTAAKFAANQRFAARFATAINRALPPEHRPIDTVATAMGEVDADRYEAVLDGKISLGPAEIIRLAAMLGVSARWLKTGDGQPFQFGFHPLSDDPLDLISLMTEPHLFSQGLGTPGSITFVACAYPLYGPALILRQFAGTHLTPYRFDIVSTASTLDVPTEGGWRDDPGCLLTHLAFLAHLHVGRGGYRGQGISSMIVSDDTYEALSRGDAHIRDLPILIPQSTWHLDLLDKKLLADPEWAFRHWRGWQEFGIWAQRHLARNRFQGRRFAAYCRGDHPDFAEAFARIETRSASSPGTLSMRPVLGQDPVGALHTAAPSFVLQ